MLKVGLTGGIGSGKTSVSDLFENLGIPVIDTDIIAHKLVNNNPEVLQEIVDVFGQDVLSLNGKLNRKKLAQIIFNVKENKQQLENILHPKIHDVVMSQLQVLSSKKNPPDYAIIVVPLLIEANYDDLVDRILVVITDEKKRIERVQKRDNKSLSEIRSIIGNQADDEKRLKKADDIIENNSNIRNLGSQVKELHKKYMHLSATIK
ncbi:MAG: dephospho-CoA kinase [Gammaproteobacteria bacterium]|nr:MAG: dephospho-CoA kinase [Gammaproteobacteria bacterium]